LRFRKGFEAAAGQASGHRLAARGRLSGDPAGGSGHDSRGEAEAGDEGRRNVAEGGIEPLPGRHPADGLMSLVTVYIYPAQPSLLRHDVKYILSLFTSNAGATVRQ
jgi:hypothetical protein